MLSLEKQQRLQELYLSETPLDTIAQELECAKNTVLFWRKKLGLRSRRLGNNPQVRAYALEQALWGDNQSLGAIVYRYGFDSRWTLNRTLRQAGIPSKYSGRSLRPGIWARLAPNGCLKCGTTKRRHDGRGLCRLCYQKTSRAEALDHYPTEVGLKRMYFS